MPWASIYVDKQAGILFYAAVRSRKQSNREREGESETEAAAALALTGYYQPGFNPESQM